jgi:hypothetical protein
MSLRQVFQIAVDRKSTDSLWEHNPFVIIGLAKNHSQTQRADLAIPMQRMVSVDVASA